MNKISKFKEYLNDIAKYDYAVRILRWEMDTVAPKKSFDYLVEASSFFEMQSFKMITGDTFKKLLDGATSCSKFDELEFQESRYILKLKDDYERLKRVPSDFYEEYTTLRNKSLNVWVEAKEKNDYSLFEPYLIEIINKTKKYYEYMYPDTDNLYECMVSTYEDGISLELIDKLFDQVKNGIIPIIKNLKKKNIPRINNRYSDEELSNIAKFLLDYIGFDTTRGITGIYTHGYTEKVCNNDVRITFSNKNDINDIISTIIHEGGHGIFEQSISKTLKNIDLYDVDKTALHESQSRFYENILGRNINFFVPIYDKLKKLLKIYEPLEKFIQRFNSAYPSLVRTKADELTYCLHIIIRYEIERDIFNGKIDLHNLKNIWNQKYKEYLNITVDDDKNGILQDMHWSEGAFGYFPTYLLGSIFDGMLLEQVEDDLGDIDTLLKENKIKKITNYLNRKIHQYGGTYNINEVAVRLFDKELNAEPLINYFKSKY